MRTSDIARAAGVHPNTVRRYEARGWLPPAGRAPNGYRVFGQRHLDCLRLARQIGGRAYPGPTFRHLAMQVIPGAVAGDWSAARERGEAYLAYVRAERAQAEMAAALALRWASDAEASAPEVSLRIGRAARLLGVSVDVLRNWERNGLINVPRDAGNGYRAYGPADISRLRVVRALTRAGYSQMAILRMLLQIDRGDRSDVRRALDTPTPDEDVYSATDHWLTTLANEEAEALRLVAMVEEIAGTQRRRDATQAPNPP